MAEEKKEEKKPAAPGPASSADVFGEIAAIIIGVMVLMAIVTNISANLNNKKIFANGWRGLTPQGILLSHTRPIASLANPIGAQVVSVKSTDVYNSPDGRRIGKHSVGDKGKILQGPVEINGERYWYVDYEEDPDGWVKESDIAYLESDLSFIEKLYIGLLSFYWYLKLFIFLLCIALMYGVVVLYQRVSNLRVEEDKLLYPKQEASTPERNLKWESILKHSDSTNENDWKIAIIEADIMLGEVLEKMSLPGETIGDKLKMVEKSDFTTLDNAWEAHKVRNQIAHDGSEFRLSQHETLRVLNLYKTVFEEFQVI